MAARYKMVSVDGKNQYLHRVIMSRMLGRSLLFTESCHHINGDKRDNRIENLELWVSSQPAGQTVPDLIDHAIELLNRYLPELDRHRRRSVRRRLDQGIVDYLSGKRYRPEISPDQLALW